MIQYPDYNWDHSQTLIGNDPSVIRMLDTDWSGPTDHR